MKIYVKTLKGSHFEIEVKPEDTVAEVKKHIETLQRPDVYPAAQQMLIRQGQVLKDNKTLAQNKVAEKSSVVVMLTKNKASPSVAATTTVPSSPLSTVTNQPACNTSQPTQPITAAASSAPTIAPLQPVTESTPSPAPTPASSIDVYGQAASNLVAGSNLEATVQQLIDMGGGSWNRDTVVQALRAAYNNPERAVEYLYYGIPEQAEVLPAAHPPASNPFTQVGTQLAPAPFRGPNANPLDLFPQGLPNLGSNTGSGTLDFLRNSQQLQALQAMVQANPQILQPMLQELGKQNPQLVQLIQENQADFLHVINEPVEGEGNILGQPPEAIPRAVTVTPEEQEAVDRLEAMGFNRALVLEVFFACNKNEELAANYLSDHMHEFDE